MTEAKSLRKIQSFVKRSGRLSKAQAIALNELWPNYGVSLTDNQLNFKELFLNSHDVTLEVGFGNGDSLLEMAIQQPKQNFLGIEVYEAGIGRLINEANKHELGNLKIIKEDAVEVLQNYIPDNSLSKFQLFFPDPWHKKRHNKRRLIKKDFLNKLALKLKEKAYIHIATDWEDYADWILDESRQCENLSLKGNEFHNKPDYRPYTKYERRGVNLGHKVWDIIFLKC